MTQPCHLSKQSTEINWFRAALVCEDPRMSFWSQRCRQSPQTPPTIHRYIHLFMFNTPVHSLVYVQYTGTFTCLCSIHRHIHLFMFNTPAHSLVYVQYTGTFNCLCSIHRYIHLFMFNTPVHSLVYVQYTGTFNCLCSRIGLDWAGFNVSTNTV